MFRDLCVCVCVCVCVSVGYNREPYEKTSEPSAKLESNFSKLVVRMADFNSIYLLIFIFRYVSKAVCKHCKDDTSLSRG